MTISSHTREKLRDFQELEQSLGAAVYDSRRIRAQMKLKFAVICSYSRRPQSTRVSLASSSFQLEYYQCVFQDLEDAYTYMSTERSESA
jgi:hypothetical protein